MTRVARVLSHYANATLEHLAYGRAWYPAARRLCRDISRESGRTVRTVAGCLAALSPRAHWKANVAWCRASCVSGVATGGLGASVRATARILGGERPLSVLRGPKVRAFYRACSGDDGATVVDVWMARAVGVSPEGLTAKRYERIARVIRAAAFIADVSPTELQATVWVVVRGGAS